MTTIDALRMNIKIIGFMVCTGLLAVTAQAQDNPVAAKALALFEQYVPTIEQSHHLAVQYRRAITGDLDGDELTDAIVEFGLGEKGSNNIQMKQAAVYLNDRGTLQVVAGYEPAFCMQVHIIKEGIIAIKELEACSLPWPETVAMHYLRLVNQELIEVEENPVGK